ATASQWSVTAVKSWASTAAAMWSTDPIAASIVCCDRRIYAASDVVIERVIARQCLECPCALFGAFVSSLSNVIQFSFEPTLQCLVQINQTFNLAARYRRPTDFQTIHSALGCECP